MTGPAAGPALDADADAFASVVAVSARAFGTVGTAVEGALGDLERVPFDTAWDVERKLAWLFVATLEHMSMPERVAAVDQLAENVRARTGRRR